jgi:Trk K+ transport system NAD-binding subunit
VAAARATGIAVVAGDARHREVLLQVGVERCRALVAVTSNDLVNLSAALNARDLRPDLRVVVRLFDPDFALRVQAGFKIRFTRSVFAAAALGSEVVMTIPVGDRRVVLFTRVAVPPASALAGRTIGSLGRKAARPVIAVVAAGGEPGDGT